MSTCKIKLISQNLAETVNKFLIFLQLNAWYTLNESETVENSYYNKISKQIIMLI